MGENLGQIKDWNGRQSLYLEGFHTIPSLLRRPLDLECFRIEAEVAVPGPEGFVGLVFGARDTGNYELVYISPGSSTTPGEIQYDPIMNGSSTWQIYNGPVYQAPVAFPAGQWTKFALEVQPHGVAVYIGETTSPSLVITNLQHGPAQGRVGFWGNLPGYIRNLSVEPIQPPSIPSTEPDLRRLAQESFITEWHVSEPYALERSDDSMKGWTVATVEENGCLNMNRLYAAAEKGAVQAKCRFELAEASESVLSLGFSDAVRLWINGENVYEGDTRWDPPRSDGRIRPDHVSIPVRWRKGLNSILVEVENHETMFGWGVAVKTGLPYVRLLT